MNLLKARTFLGQDKDGEFYDDVYKIYENGNNQGKENFLLTVLGIHSKVAVYFSLNEREITLHKSYKRDAYDPDYKSFEISYEVFKDHINENDFKEFISFFVEDVIDNIIFGTYYEESGFQNESLNSL